MTTKLMTLVEVTGNTTKATVEITGGLTVTVEGESADSVFQLLGKIASGPAELDVKPEKPKPRKRERRKRGKSARARNKEVREQIIEFATKNPTGFNQTQCAKGIKRSADVVKPQLKALVDTGEIRVVNPAFKATKFGVATKLYGLGKVQKEK